MIINFSTYIKETRETPKEVLDLFTDRIQSIKLDDDLELKVERTKGSYKIIIQDDNKTIARLYIQSINNKNGKFYAEVRRVHVNDDYRNKGLGSKLMEYVVKVFGDLNLYLYPSPNRIKDLNDENREIYRNMLRKFYGKYGFKEIEGKNRMERYVEGIRWYNKGKLGEVEKDNWEEPQNNPVGFNVSGSPKKGEYFYRGLLIRVNKAFAEDLYHYNIYRLNPKIKRVRDGMKYYPTPEEALEKAKNYIDEFGYRIEDKHPGNITEEVRWYEKGKLGPEQKLGPDMFEFEVGNNVTRMGTVWRWSEDVDITKDNFGGWVITDIEIYNIRVERVANVVNKDGYTGQVIKIWGKWPWYQTTNLVLGTNEEVRWYQKGKLGPDEKIDVSENIFKIGDRVKMPKRTGEHLGAYWNDNKDSYSATSLKNKGKWTPYTSDSVWRIKDIAYVEDLDGYTGTMLHFDDVWPWFQETGFIKHE